MRWVLALAAVVAALASASAAQAAPRATGAIIAEPQGGGIVITTATFKGVSNKGGPEQTVQCADPAGNVNYSQTAIFPNTGFSYLYYPWAVEWGLPSGEACTATLFYLTWQGQQQTGTVTLASVGFTA